MTYHVWKRLDNFPLIFIVIFAVGIFLPCLIALTSGHVTPYVPYISEGGGEFPEAGIFSTFISISSFLSQWIIYIRYLIVEEINSKIGNYTNSFLNKISFALGGFATIAMIIVAAFPASTISQVHNSAAGAASVCYVMYLMCQTLISYRQLGNTKVSKCRLGITICSIVSLLLITIFGLLGSSEWTATYWAGKKTPGDHGFAYYVVSGSAEWTTAILLMIFFSTFISEFKKCLLHFELEISGSQPRQKPRLSDLDIRHA